MEVKQVRLSSQSVYIDYRSHVHVRPWKKINNDGFSFCTNNCESSDEHEYAFDGQFFYKKKQGA